MKKVLILAYDFPPYVSVGGLRPFNWYKHFKEFDIEPIVITRQWGNTYGNALDYIAEGISNELITESNELGTVLRTPYHPNLSNRLLLKYGEKRFKIIRKAISAFYEFGQFLFPIGPKVELYKAAKTYLKTDNVDLILATGDPFVLFRYASKLSKKHNIPWIADYRDPWSQSFSAKKGFFHRKFDLFFEKRIVKTALQINTVDQLFKLKLNQLFPTKQIEIFPNGFDEIEIARTNSIEQKSEILTFSFIGTIYLWHPIRELLNDFAIFSAKHPEKDFRVKFYGINNADEISELVNSQFTELKEKIVLIAKLPNGELLAHLAKDNVLLLFNYFQFTGTKIYDYLGLKRKILLCYENSEEAKMLKNQYYFHEIETDITPQIDIINKTNSGVIVRDSQHLINVIEGLFSEFQETGRIFCNSKNVENYSRKIQVEKLADLIKSL
jgi:glycosyltransferase involved in cell wall biosynthesis